MIIIKRVLIYTIILFFVKAGWGQFSPSSKSESLISLTDSILKQEISTFTLRGRDNHYSVKPRLEEIPLRKCSDSFASFNKGNFYGTEIIVKIESDSTGTITNLYYELHGKYLVEIPKRIFSDINGAQFCQQNSRKNNPISSEYKVFRSKDKRRGYVYMLNGDGTSKYEVTWVIQNSEYLTRVIDCCF